LVSFDAPTAWPELADFPVRIALTPARIDFSRTQAAGADLRFVDPSTGDLLPHEIESWDPAAASDVWVRLPRLSGGAASNAVWMYFDNPLATDAQSPTAVWDASTRMVLHLGEAVADEGIDGIHADSTANGHAARQVGNARAVGQIGGAQLLDGVDDYLELSSSLSAGVTDFTYSLWVNWAGGAAFQRLVDFNDGPATATSGAYFFSTPRDNSSVPGGMLFSMSLAGYTNDASVGGPVLASTEWKHVTLVCAAPTMSIYVDGEEVAADALAAAVSLSEIGAVNHWLGRSAFGPEDPNLAGMIDEVRFSDVARSPAWIAADFASTRDVGFASFGPTETGP
jgi:hypothetical protein